MNAKLVESVTKNAPAGQLRSRIAAIAAALITVDLQIRAFPEGFNGSPFENIREQYESHRAAALSIPNQFLMLVNDLDQIEDLEVDEGL